MDRKMIAVVAVIVIAVAAIAVYLTLDRNGNDGDDVEFLIQDDSGVYFWVEGQGDSVEEAWIDAMERYDIPYVPSKDMNGNPTGIDSMFGMGMESIGQVWIYWVQYCYEDGVWVESPSFMSALDSETHDRIALVYGDGSVMPAVVDSEVWDRSSKGTVFTIQSDSGMYFRINGEGQTVMDAFVDAVDDYNIPCVITKDPAGVSFGVDSMFGMGMESDGSGWLYWSQFVGLAGTWTPSMTYMNDIASSDCLNFALYYANGMDEPTCEPY